MSPSYTSQLSVVYPHKGAPWEMQADPRAFLALWATGHSQLWSGRCYSSICCGFGHINLGTVLQAKELHSYSTHLFQGFFSFPSPMFPLTCTGCTKEKLSPLLDFCPVKMTPLMRFSGPSKPMTTTSLEFRQNPSHFCLSVLQLDSV